MINSEQVNEAIIRTKLKKYLRDHKIPYNPETSTEELAILQELTHKVNQYEKEIMVFKL